MRKSILICLVLSLIWSCNPDRHFDKDYLDNDNPAVIVKNITVFQYSSLTCQMSFNRAKKQFRAFNDDMSDFFVVDLGQLPTSKGQKISGCSISWTSKDDLKSIGNITFKVEDINSDGTVWLWGEDDRVVVILQML